MNLVVVETADAGGLDPSRLCFQIEHLTNGEEIPTVLDDAPVRTDPQPDP